MAADCGSSCPVSGGFYSYRPSVAGNIVLLVVYALLVPCILYLGFRSRTALLSTVLMMTGLALEILGFVGRVLLHHSAESPDYFTLSLLGTILGPSFVSAALFVAVPHLFIVYGEKLGPFNFRPVVAGLTLYTLIAAAIGVEAVGVVFVSYEFHGVTRDRSASIIAAGLGVQAVSLLFSAAVYFFCVLGLDSGQGVLDDSHATVYSASRFRRFLRGVEISTSLLLVYSIYRIIELAGGVDGTLFQNEAAFMIMDGALPLAPVLLLTILHPGTAFGKAWTQTSSRRARRPNPLPLQQVHRLSHSAHHAYDPNIRKHLTPQSPNSQRTARSSHAPGVANGSPGLPTSPRPSHKSPSPKVSSPNSTTATSKRFSDRSEKRITLQKELVDSETLW
ncbi:hypothetical protein C2857_007194 [Epichloe festucae Fl1]|uniref:Uncharacterized protein n=1 Tax=Epichloe festucae (strain Fl1) TaxID=877507 RepID=A0A7S9PUW4_EPIFF|nr:hypothetical protein C2857_007194 [Epichloe festucae Fl1]